jgi:hypothetical protein
MNKHVDLEEGARQTRKSRGLAAFGCGCVIDWSDDPPLKREAHARGAVDGLVAAILEDQGGAS